ncbi:transposase [Intestinibacter sp.]
MGRKAKVPYELKLASVLEYIKGNKTSSQLATKLGVNYNTIIKWVLLMEPKA